MHPQNRNLDSNGAISEKGYRTIASCLLIAYEEANFLYTNKDVLYGRLTQCKAILSESLSRLDALRHEFLPEKMRMKSLLKTHALSQREYMRFIEAHDAEVVSMKETLRGVYRSVYSDFPGRRFPHRVEEQGMAFVIKYFYQASS
ncbi:MAG TPA: hypothetical protein VMX33_14890 [bacterium]|nr:hypothetical protein [bacterium]